MADPDDVDARFREMMLAEFGSDTKPRNSSKREDHGSRHGSAPAPRSFLDDDSYQRPSRRRNQRRHDEGREPRSLAEEMAALSAADDDFVDPQKGHDYWFSMSDAIDSVELDPEPPYRESGSWFRPSLRGWLAIVALVLSVVLTLLAVMDIVNIDFGLLAGLLFGTSIALALSLIPWRKDDDEFNDGARV